MRVHAIPYKHQTNDATRSINLNSRSSYDASSTWAFYAEYGNLCKDARWLQKLVPAQMMRPPGYPKNWRSLTSGPVPPKKACTTRSSKSTSSSRLKSRMAYSSGLRTRGHVNHSYMNRDKNSRKVSNVSSLSSLGRQTHSFEKLCIGIDELSIVAYIA